MKILEYDFLQAENISDAIQNCHAFLTNIIKDVLKNQNELVHVKFDHTDVDVTFDFVDEKDKMVFINSMREPSITIQVNDDETIHTPNVFAAIIISGLTLLLERDLIKAGLLEVDVE